MNDVLFEIRNGGAFVTLNRPEVRNAINPAVLLAICDFLARIDGNPEVRYLVLRGEGVSFSSGGDIGAYADALDKDPAELRSFFERRVRGNAECFYRLHTLEIPVISVAQGAVAGAGINFLLTSDFVLATEDAMLFFAQTRIGLPLDLSLTYFLPRIIGAKRARQLALTGGRLGAAEAKDLGIIDQVMPSDAMDDALATLIKSLAAVAPRAAGRSKLLINSSEDHGLVAQMEREVEAIGECVVEPDFREGVRAFVEKRFAQFSGQGR
ncbi:MAG: enoyl-CoA hydratase-related protein [Pontixanthobacter sp.]